MHQFSVLGGRCIVSFSMDSRKTKHRCYYKHCIFNSFHLEAAVLFCLNLTLNLCIYILDELSMSFTSSRKSLSEIKCLLILFQLWILCFNVFTQVSHQPLLVPTHWCNVACQIVKLFINFLIFISGLITSKSLLFFTSIEQMLVRFSSTWNKTRNFRCTMWI